MGIHDQTAKLVNKIGQPIGFEVDRGVCPLHDLPAGESRRVSLNLIRKLCRRRGSPDWPIRVLINDRFYGMRLYPCHLLKMTRIVFRYKFRADGSYVLIVEGVAETFLGRFFGCCVKLWENKVYLEISEADSTWSIRNSQEPNTARLPVRNENNLSMGEDGDPDNGATPLIGSKINILQFRQPSWRKIILAFPTHKLRLRRLWNGSGGGCANSNAATAAAGSRKRRLYRLLSLRRRDHMFNRFILFVCAFIFVGSVHLLLNHV